MRKRNEKEKGEREEKERRKRKEKEKGEREGRKKDKDRKKERGERTRRVGVLLRTFSLLLEKGRTLLNRWWQGGMFTLQKNLKKKKNS